MILSIYVKPNSKVDQIWYDEAGNLKVKIKAQPVDGKANTYLIAYLSGLLNLPKSNIEILKGSTSQFKKLKIDCEEEKITSFLHTLKQAK